VFTGVCRKVKTLCSKSFSLIDNTLMPGVNMFFAQVIQLLSIPLCIVELNVV
jgi:hypothetical protein